MDLWHIFRRLWHHKKNKPAKDVPSHVAFNEKVADELVILIVGNDGLLKIELSSLLTNTHNWICDQEGNIFGKKVRIITANSASDAVNLFLNNQNINMMIVDGKIDQRLGCLAFASDRVAVALVGWEDYHDARQLGVSFINKPVASDSLKDFVEKAVKKMA